MCHSIPVLQHAHFKPWQCSTHYIICQSTSKER